MHRHLGESSLVAGRLAKERKKEAHE